MAAIAPSARIAEPSRHALRWGVTWTGLRYATGNVALATTFFVAAYPGNHYQETPANVVWMAGAVIMGVMSLVRRRPQAVMLDARAFASTAVMLLPVLMKVGAPS